MSNASIRYNPRFELTELIQQDRDELISAPVYRDDTLQEPSAGTVSVYNAARVAVVDAEAVTVVGGVATYTIPAAVLAPEQLGKGWSVVWKLTMPDGLVHTFDNEAALVRRRLYPTITGPDLWRGRSYLDPSSTTVITTITNYQPLIDEADVELQNEMIADERRPWLIVSPAALRQTWIYLTITLVFEDLAAREPDAYLERAKEWRGRYESAYLKASALFDYDQDGFADTLRREAVKPAVVWFGC
jgi:hypothetical protein